MHEIEAFDADIIGLPEAFHPTSRGGSFKKLLALVVSGSPYQLVTTNYDDTDGRVDMHALAVLVRSSLGATVSVVSLGTRNALRVDLADRSIFVVHLDDRTEARRIAQFNRLLQLIGDTERVVIMGDFNATQSRTWPSVFILPLAKLWRKAGWPIGEPGHNQTRVARIGSLVTRLASMMTSGVMGMAKRAGFKDLDPMNQPTMRFVQLDHVIARGLSGEAHPRPVPGSDHRPVVAFID